MEDNNYITERFAEIENEGSGTVASKKPRHKFTDNFVFYMLAAFLLVLVGQILGMILVYLPIGIVYGADAALSALVPEYSIVNGIEFSPLLATASQYLFCIGMWLVCLLWFLKKDNRFLYKTIGTAEKGNNIPMFLLGLLIGAVTNGLCILAAYLHGDIYMYYDSFKPLPLLLIFVSVFIQSSAEELICRCYLYRKLLNRYNPAVSILVSSLLFSLLHAGNPGVGIIALIDIFLSGLQFALMVYYFDSLWCAFAAHTAWNFTQNILFGLPNSGLVVPFSIFKLDAASATDSLFYNVGFGVEGTIFAVIIEAAACLLIFLWGRNRARKKEIR